MWFYKPIECNECGTVYKVTLPGRSAFGFFAIIPMLVFMLLLTPFNNFMATFGISLLILIIGSLLTPFFVIYEKEND